jgi:predicted phosphate transport protein (TIGR00153 family)
MFARFMPREGKFFDLFNAHAELIVLGGRELAALVGALGDSRDEAMRHAKSVDEIEKKADRITHETIQLLHRTFITPLGRDEIHGLITAMDDILDMMQDVAQTVTLYDIHALTEQAKQLADICLSCSERVRSAVGLLNDTSSGSAVLKTCGEIGVLESDADRVMRSAMSKLFRDEPDTRQLIKLKAIYELLEAITDRCDDVANLIEGIVLENS